MPLQPANWSLPHPHSRPSPSLKANPMAIKNLIHHIEDEEMTIQYDNQPRTTQELPSPRPAHSVAAYSDPLWQMSADDTNPARATKPRPRRGRKPSRISRSLSSQSGSDSGTKCLRHTPSATIFSRQFRGGSSSPPFGEFRNGRFYCSYRHDDGRICDSWPAGYSAWYDLGRHADAEHATDEAQKIEEGLLTFETSQWIKSQDQLDAIKRVTKIMTCHACGTTFASGRCDSVYRHVQKGACLRAQRRLHLASSSPTTHRKKTRVALDRQR
ncbi:hypothetical protein BU17DRAFT_84703 [Hysterangium stoloniferum]|nr:hypothetical protein BU17DRAFT_84703 [Hysterangium stoloniferum]